MKLSSTHNLSVSISLSNLQVFDNQNKMYNQPRFSTSKFVNQKELKDAMWDAEMSRKSNNNQINQERLVLKLVTVPGPSDQIRNQINTKVISMRLPGINFANKAAPLSLRRDADYINFSFEKVHQFLLNRIF